MAHFRMSYSAIGGDTRGSLNTPLRSIISLVTRVLGPVGMLTPVPESRPLCRLEHRKRYLAFALVLPAELHAHAALDVTERRLYSDDVCHYAEPFV